MAGFLDKQDRIVDMVLTNEGKDLLAKGKLRFVYFKLFDDEVDYDPYLSNSGSLSAEGLSGSIYEQIEYTPVREATTGYRARGNVSGSDHVSVYRPLFTVPQGQSVLPRLTSSVAPSSSFTIEVHARKHQEIHVKKDQNGNEIAKFGPFDRGVERFGSSVHGFDFDIDGPFFPVEHQEGVLVRVLLSGAEGFVDLKHRRDLVNDISYGMDFKLKLTSEES